MWHIVRDLAGGGATIFLTTQYLDGAGHLAGRVAVLDHGRIAAEGSTEQLKRRIPGGHIRLRFAGPGELESAACVLAPLGAAARDDETLALQVPGDGDGRSLRDLLNRLARASVEVQSVSIHTPDLDDVFLAITGHASAQAGVPGDVSPDPGGHAGARKETVR